MSSAVLPSFIVILFFALTAGANPRCIELFQPPIQTEKGLYNFELKGVVFKTGPQPKLSDRWEEGWLHYHGIVDEMTFRFGIDVEGDVFKQTLPRGMSLSGKIFHEFSWGDDAERGIDLVHKGYGDRLSDKEKQLVGELDEKSFGTIWTKNQLGYAGVVYHREFQQEKLVGFLRVIDGNVGKLPAELILERKQIKCDRFQELRDARMQIFEVGKYSLSYDLNPTQLKKVRRALLRWLRENYLTGNLDKLVFIADVSSEQHARAYKRMFGMTEIGQSHFTPALQSPDAILEVSGRVLYERLRKIIDD